MQINVVPPKITFTHPSDLTVQVPGPLSSNPQFPVGESTSPLVTPLNAVQDDRSYTTAASSLQELDSTPCFMRRLSNPYQNPSPGVPGMPTPEKYYGQQPPAYSVKPVSQYTFPNMPVTQSTSFGPPESSSSRSSPPVTPLGSAMFKPLFTELPSVPTMMSHINGLLYQQDPTKLVMALKAALLPGGNAVADSDLWAVANAKPDANYQAIINALKYQQLRNPVQVTSWLKGVKMLLGSTEHLVDYQALITQVENLQTIARSQPQSRGWEGSLPSYQQNATNSLEHASFAGHVKQQQPEGKYSSTIGLSGNFHIRSSCKGYYRRSDCTN